MAYINLKVTSISQIPYKRLEIKMRTSHINLETKRSISKIFLSDKYFGSVGKLYVTDSHSPLQSVMSIKG